MQTTCPHCGADVEIPAGALTVICHDCHTPVHGTAEAKTVDASPPAEERTITRTPAERTSPDAPTLTTARVRFNCPGCGMELTVPPDEPLAECPRCGASLEGVDQSAPAVGAPTGAAGAGAAAPRVRSRERSAEPGQARGLDWMQEHFKDGYEVLEFVKSGGMGAVYKARQRRPSRFVALKVLLGGHFATARQLKRFEREAQAVAMLQHPAIVPVYEYGEADGQPYFTMEFVEGLDFRSFALKNRLHREEVCRLMVRVCDAIQYAHEHGVIHRDLKPGNILVDEMKRPRILDFGLSRAPVAEGDEEDRLTLTGEYLGTPRYMSPEQAMGRPRAVDERTDVFALGAMLYELLVGSLPYPVENVRGLKVVEVLTTWEPLRPSALRPEMPRDLEVILLKAVARDKEQRYQSARELGEDLENWLAGRPIKARPATLEYLLNRWLWRHRKVLAPVALAALVLAAVSGYYVVRLRQEVMARRARDAIISQLQPMEKRYLESFLTGRQAVDQAVLDGDWQSAETLAQGARKFWPGEPGVDELARQVRRAAELFARRQTAAYAASVEGQEYGKARQAAAAMHEVAARMPYEDLAARLAAVQEGFAEHCWQALKASAEAAYTPEQVSGQVGAFLTEFADGPHAAEARALVADLSARSADYFLPQHGKAFELAMAERRWPEAQRVLDSLAAMLAQGPDPRWSQRLAAMSARLGAVIRLETAADVRPLARIEQSGIVYGLAYAPDGKLLAVVTGEQPVALWEPEAGRSVQTLPQQAALRTVAFSPDGRQLAAGAEDGSVEVWSLSSGRLERTLKGHVGRIRSLCFTPDGRRLVTADRDAVKVWDLESGAPVQVPNLKGTAPAALSPDGDLVAAATDEDAVGLWELATGLPVQTLRTGTAPVVMAFSPDGSLLATGHTEPAGRRVRLWRVEDGRMAEDLGVRVGPEILYEKLTWALAFSPDGALLATGDVDNNVKLWDVATGRQLAALGFASVPRCLAFSPDSRFLTAGLTRGSVAVLGVGGQEAVTTEDLTTEETN